MILILLFSVALFLEKTHHIHLYHNRRERLEITFLFFFVGVIWDTFAIWRGHWAFPAGSNVGIVIGLMPLEEYLFALVVPLL
ncbi:lycopene cyclase domain-containing protein [Candidatus Woesearchaeota archaeon]|nr:lycopene cyclase domain-containing protein [Candidatus Woesearchaeota archaeon]